MIPPYYCRTCDRYDMAPHRHDPFTVLAVGAVLIVVAMVGFLFLFASGQLP